MNLNKKRRLEAEAAADNSPQKKQRIVLYLADYTPIRTIEVTNIADNVCSGYLKGYFEHATGSVTDVTILEKSEGSQEVRTAFVTFLIPEDAASLICDVNSQSSIKFTIKEADSVHQPKIDPNILNFEDINDDCLLHITSYLDLIDVVNLGKASTRLQSFAQHIYRKKCHFFAQHINRKKWHFSFGTNTGDSSINELNLPIILQEMGDYVQTIEWRDLGSTHLDFLSQYCPNVTSLKLTCPLYNVNSISIKKNKKFFKNLKTLDIDGAKFFDNALKTILSTSSKLKSLRLNQCNNICGNFFSKCKSSKFKCLTITNSRNVNCEEVYRFLWNQKLTKFTSDFGCSFKQCVSAPSHCLKKFKELELDFYSLTDDELISLKFEDLERLTDLTVTCKYSQSFRNCNNLLAAMSQVTTLKSLKLQNVRIDGGTVEQLGSFKNLQKINFNNCVNTIGKQLYSSIPVHLPQVTTLNFNIYVNPMGYNVREKIDFKTNCDMISSLNNLKYFSHSSMTWELLDMILKVQLSRKQPAIEIGLWEFLWNDPKKMEFAARCSKGAMILSLREYNL